MLVMVENQWRCPSCDHLSILDKHTAVEAFSKVVCHLDEILDTHLQDFDMERLALHVLWQREKFARNFLDTYQAFNLKKFMAFNALVRRIMTQKNPKGGIVADEANTIQLVDAFTEYVGIVDHIILLENGFNSLSVPEGFDLKATSWTEIIRNTRLFVNETYMPVLETFENNDILRDKEAERKIQEQRTLAEALRDQVLLSGRKIHRTSAQVIEDWYSVLNQLYCGLRRNRMFEKTFDLSSFTGFSPDRIMDFVNQFPLIEGSFTCARADDFLKRLQLSFPGRRPNLLKRKFLFSKDNTRIFPLFVRLGYSVYISHRTSFIVYLLLHPILYKTLFDKETEKRSLAMERREAQAVFKQNAFAYRSNLKDNEKHPTLEIDGIATCGSMMYVVECKGWDLKPLYEHAFRQSDLERDLKGIVDGKKYEMKDDKLRWEKRVSLLDKLQFTKQNMAIWGFDPSQYSDIEGLIIIRATPPIQEYKGVKILSINQVGSLTK